MKKIIATVLAVVMALALSVTAFAADSTSLTAKDYSFKDATTNVNGTATADGDSLTYYAESKSTVTVNGKTTVTVTPAYYWLHTVSGDEYYVSVDSSCADTKLVKGGAIVDYAIKLTVAPGTAYQTSDVVSKTIEGVDEPSCGQYKDGTYYVVNGDVYEAADATDFDGCALLNGKVVLYKDLCDGDFVDHALNTSKVTVDKSTVTSVYCDNCKKYVPVVKSIPLTSIDSYKSVNVSVVTNQSTAVTGTYYYLTSDNGASTTTPTTGTATSPKTFDAGIAMYVGMALTSVAGSAVVIGKKKEF